MALQPEMILRFGAMPVSKSLMFYLKEHANVPQYIIDSGQGWRDPTSTASEIIYCDERLFCEELTQLVRNKEAFQSPNWISKWVKLNQLVHTVINKHDLEELTEMKVFYDLQKLIPTDAWLFVGNSMPIRDLDAFYHCHDGLQTVIGNRGVNGIDGLVSTALGVSVEKKHSYLLIGDLSFYHDLNGLLAAKLHQLNLTIIVINNNGGAIFSMLPQADHPKHFELLFGTPTDLQFENVTKMYGGKHFLVESLQQFVDAIKKANELAGLKVIEVMTNRVENAEYRRKLWEDVSQEIIRWLEHEAKGESNGTNN